MKIETQWQIGMQIESLNEMQKKRQASERRVSGEGYFNVDIGDFAVDEESSNEDLE